MFTLIVVLHVIVAVGLIIFVLLQDPKGGAMGVFGGGTSNTIFGATGASNLLTTTTKWLAIIFAATCLSLAYFSSQKSSSVLDKVTVPVNSALPETPAETAPMETAPVETPAQEGSTETPNP